METGFNILRYLLHYLGYVEIEWERHITVGIMQIVMSRRNVGASYVVGNKRSLTDQSMVTHFYLMV